MRGRVVEVENAKEIIGEIGDGFQVFRFKENPAFLQSFLLLCLAQNVLSFEHHSHSYFLRHLLSSLLPKTLNPSSSSSLALTFEFLCKEMLLSHYIIIISNIHIN